MKIDVRKITSVHIHGAYNFLPVYNFLRLCGIENDVVKILTTHNPWKPEFEDVFHFTKNRPREWLVQNEAKIAGYRHFLRLRDDFAFRMSDALFFPSEHSMEGYHQDWPEFAEIAASKPIYFSVTGTEKKAVSLSADAMRAQHGIPANARVFLHLGRFIPMRGFDLYVEAAKQVLGRDPNAWFLAVGEKQDKPSLDHPRWIEVPFTTAPGNYLNLADACVIANRGSYFDLSMIEALSLGTPLVSAKIGGYKYLEGRTDGVLYFEPGSVDSLTDALTRFCQLSPETLTEWRRSNAALYEREMTPQKFATGYQDTIDQLYADFKIRPTDRKIVRLPFELPRDETTPMLNSPRATTAPGTSFAAPAGLPHGSKTPVTAPGAAKLAEELEQKGLLQAAADLYRTAAYLDPKRPDLRRKLAEVLIRLGNRAEAISHLEYASNLIPNNRNLQKRLAKIKHPIRSLFTRSEPFKG
ncbi:glycosyltransferase [Roseibium aestuarii]|uniref:Glycosyltransferase n=1 Tax=Roseibium aestuarii TaxID=2600299 RepID=A0ABW4JXE3_9HYPH|nr:glycosyltransferase [Roseibium aestuarii]